MTRGAMQQPTIASMSREQLASLDEHEAQVLTENTERERQIVADAIINTERPMSGYGAFLFDLATSMNRTQAAMYRAQADGFGGSR